MKKSICIALIAGLAGMVAPAMAQEASTTTAPAVRSSGVPQRDTLRRMMTPLTVEFKDARLEAVIQYLAEHTGAEIEPMWIDDQNSEDGLDKDKLINLKVKGLPALTVLERAMAKAVEDPKDRKAAPTWQLTENGELQVGPRPRLNLERRLEIYDVNDLLMVIPDFANAPEFDLQQVLRQSRGGGGGGSSQSPFRDTQRQRNDENRRPREERAQDVKKVITELVEYEQWVDNAGDAATIRYYQGTFIVDAPDYVHRQINGYKWWPAGYTARTQGGRRWVTMSGESVLSQPKGIEKQPVFIPPK